MEYPSTHFTSKWRKAMLLAFILAFFIIAPLVILTTAGYRIDWVNRWFAFRGTGSVSIDILPTEATVYLNGIRLLGSMPYRLNALTPDNPYTLKITADGYYDWQKNIDVRSNETFYLKDIAMLKKNEPTLMTTGTISSVSSSPDDQTIVYTLQKNGGTELWIQDSVTLEKTLLTKFTTFNTITASWNTTGAYGLLHIKEPTGSNWFSVVNAARRTITSLSETLGTQVEKAMWNQSSEPEMYVATSSSLFVYRPQSGSFQNVGKLNSKHWFVDRGHVLTLEQSTSTRSLIIINNVFGFPNTLSTISQNELEPGEQDNWDIVAKIGQNVLLTRPDGHFAKLVTSNVVYTIPATQFLVSEFNNWLILWNNTEIWTYAQGEEPKLLNRSGENLKTIVPVDEYNTLALAWEKSTTVLYPYYLISHEILPGIRAMAANTNKRILYFSGTVKNSAGLWQLAY